MNGFYAFSVKMKFYCKYCTLPLKGCNGEEMLEVMIVEMWCNINFPGKLAVGIHTYSGTTAKGFFPKLTSRILCLFHKRPLLKV